MTESKLLMEMNPAPPEQSAPKRKLSGGLLDSGQREGRLCFSSCEPVLFFSLIILFSVHSAESIQCPVPQHAFVWTQAGLGVGRHGGDGGGPETENSRPFPR